MKWWKAIQKHYLSENNPLDIFIFKMCNLDYPGGLVVRNLPANAGDIGSIPVPGRFHMPWGN